MTDRSTTTVPKTTRKHSRRHLANRVLTDVRAHPANAPAPNRAAARAVGWQLRKRISSRPVTIQAYGRSLRFPRSSGSLSNYFYFGEAFEWEIVSFVRSFLRPGDVVVDVGANVGMFSYAVAQVIRSSGSVHAFEPLAWAASVIRSNAETNCMDNLHVHEAAASDRAGVARLSSDLDVSSHLEWTAAASSYSRESTTVRTVRLDEELDEDLSLALVKIDVEGAEAKALAGFERHLEVGNPPVIVIEAHDHSLRKLGSSRAEVLALLQDANYVPCRFGVSANRLLADVQNEKADVIAVRADRSDWVADRLGG